MSDAMVSDFAYDDGDVDVNNSDNPSLNELISARLSRRETMRSGASALAFATVGAPLLASCDDKDEVAADPSPTVTAGSSGTASTGGRVTLTGTATDNGTIASQGFTQVSGPTVTLTGATTNAASFIAPAVSAATPLVFRFTATDNAGNSSTVDTTVTVNPAALSFQTVAKNRTDVVTVPPGHTVQILSRTGDPIAAGVPAYANNGTDTNFAQRIGDHGDALYWYGLSATGTRDDAASTRGLMVQNHENLNDQYLHVAGGTTVNGARPESEAIKEIEAHGVSVVEWTENAQRQWSMVLTSAFNRRITPNTPMTFTGPVAGHPLLRTAFSNDGRNGRGTINNCANGHTLWGTNITCEENWAGYFRRAATDNANRSAREITQLNRYGITQGASGSYGWATVVAADATNTLFRRWNLTVDTTRPADGTGDFRNEANQFGWCVEIDPYNAASTPRKRTALGRFNHEGAWFGRFIAGQKLAVYLGDDARGEYFYKFVSTENWATADASAADRLAIGDKYLNSGTLYVARFNADGTGVWLPLTFGQVPNRPATGNDPVYVFADQNDILLHTRLAGDAVGATRMDRPEWTATNNVNGDIYLTLTNNNAALRPLTGTDAANPRHYNDPRGTTNQFGNPNGHILRLREGTGEGAATSFTWDIYLFGADSIDASAANVNLSGLTAANDFSSPDGLWFARPQNPSGLVRPLLWIQTDDGAFTDRTNNQMLAALPGSTGDGGSTAVRTITNVGSGGATATQTTRVGAAATEATVKRFLVGPIECEITGVDSTPDGRTLFVGIQHPGEGGTPAAPSSAWPDTQATGSAPAGTRPRSAIAIIQRTDGGIVGL